MQSGDAQAGGLLVPSLHGQPDRGANGGIDAVEDIDCDRWYAAQKRCRRHGSVRVVSARHAQTGERMTRDALQRFAKGERRFVLTTSPNVMRSERVERIRTGLAPVHVSEVLERQLALELRQRIVFAALSEEYQSEQPVQTGGSEASVRLLSVLRRRALTQVLAGPIEVAPRHEHGRREPVCQRQPRSKREGLSGGAKPFTAPAHRRQPEMMRPVVRVERERFSRGGHGFASIACSMAHQRKRPPGVRRRWIQTATLARMLFGACQQPCVRYRVGPR